MDDFLRTALLALVWGTVLYGVVAFGIAGLAIWNLWRYFTRNRRQRT